MTDPDRDQLIAAMRRFNRFYTQKIGVLHEGLVDSPFSLTEARILYDWQRASAAATELAADLDLDPGYLSRILRGFETRGLLERAPAPQDGRRQLLSLTPSGRAAFAPLDRGARAQIGALLEPLSPGDRAQLSMAMQTIETALGDGRPATPFTLRTHRPGDMGWVVHRHGVLYAQEYGWDERFEALVAEIAAGFIGSFDPQRERCWIAEQGGAAVGSVFLVADTETVAKLRLLLVEPAARGLGIGVRLVDECIRFARGAGYTTLALWTNSVLLAAREIYRKAGFRLVETAPHRSFGRDLVGENWELPL